MTEPKDQPTTSADEDDTSGHSLGDDYARQHAAQRVGQLVGFGAHQCDAGPHVGEVRVVGEAAAQLAVLDLAVG